MTRFFEVQCDGLVGPTHNYAGLSFGNVASEANAKSASRPKQAALQGLQKMRFVASLGIPQLVIPPHPRPNIAFLKALGFGGSLQEILTSAGEEAPEILHAAWSASGMWAANMATVSPAPDTKDGCLHLIPANLASTVHRQQEAAFSLKLLRRIFGEVAEIHAPLPAGVAFTDEGAANHMRLTEAPGQPGVEIFVYGKERWQEQSARSGDRASPERGAAITPTAEQEARRGAHIKDQRSGDRASPERGVAAAHCGGSIPEQGHIKFYPARQKKAASEAIARLHGVKNAVFVQQTPEAIDAGVFHNDVIAMSNERLLIYHEKAFVGEEAFLQELCAAFPALRTVRITEEELPLRQAVASYFFNSQLLSLPEGGMLVVAPQESAEIPQAKACFERLRDNPDVPVREVRYLNLRESMKNGGGPACLRLRVVLEEAQLKALPSGVVYSAGLHEKLEAWVEHHYPEELTSPRLRDAVLAQSLRDALLRLEELLGLEGLYEGE